MPPPPVKRRVTNRYSLAVRMIAWLAVGASLLTVFWAFQQEVRVVGSEHAAGRHGVRAAAAVTEHGMDAHHKKGPDPASWDFETNVREAQSGLVRYGGDGPAAVVGGAAGAARAFCKDEGDTDIFVTPRSVELREVTRPLPPDVLPAIENVTCGWTRLDYKDLSSNLRLCTYDPEVDTVISSAIHRGGKWVGVLEWEAMRSSGMCSKRRPFVLDIGAGFGSFALMAASIGCLVIAFEPHPPNMARMMESFAANGYLGNATFILNAIHRSQGDVNVVVETHNPGAVRIVRVNSESKGVVAATTLRDFFLWSKRPRHPTTGYRITPNDIAAIRVDTEGHGLAVLDSFREVLAAGNPPVVSLHYYPGLSRNGVGCDAKDFMDFAYESGYKMYLAKDLWSRQKWYDYLEKETWSTQAMLVHKSIASSLGSDMTPFDSVDTGDDAKPAPKLAS